MQMKRFFVICITVLCGASTMSADESAYQWSEHSVDTTTSVVIIRKDHKPWAKENWTFLHTNEGVKPFKPLDDLTFVGVPIFAAGWIAKSEKHGFKQQEDPRTCQPKQPDCSGRNCSAAKQAENDWFLPECIPEQ